MNDLTTTAAALRQKAAASEKAAAESFARSDTRGALSQWGNDLTARKAKAEADLIEAGGVFPKQALFDLEGNQVPAKRIPSKFGYDESCWAILDGWDWDKGRYTGEFISDAKRQKTFEKKGYRKGVVLAPVEIELVGSGMVNVSVAWVQTGFGAEVLSDGQGWDRPPYPDEVTEAK